MKRLVLLGLLLLTACSVPGFVNPLAVLQPTATPVVPTALDGLPEVTPSPVAGLSERIVFSSERTGNAEIYVMNADGSGLARLTDHPSRDYQPVWSPNRRQIAFVSDRTGVPNIHLISADGTNIRQLTDAAEGAIFPSFAPDGQRLAFVALRGTEERALVQLTLAEEREQVLFTELPGLTNPAYAPNGRQIVFSGLDPSNGNNREIYLANLDRSGTLINLTNSLGEDDAPSFSPDGRRIAFHSNRTGVDTIYVMEAGGAAQTPLTDGSFAARDPSWAPDGRQLVFSGDRDGRFQIFGTDDAGAPPQRLGSAPADEITPAFPPPPPTTINDQLLISVGAVGGTRNLQLLSIGGVGRTSLTEDLLIDNITAAFAPDGQRIAFASDRGGNYDIYVMNSDGSGLVLIASSPGRDLHPVWSPDGERIAFESNRTGNWDVFVVNADGSGGLINITNHPANDGTPTWSPDGERIAFASNREGQFEIYVIDRLNPATLTNLSNHPANDVQPVWSPDGQSIVMRSDRTGDNEIYLIDTSGQPRIRRLTFHPADDTTPAFAPDGRRIAFASNRSEVTVTPGSPTIREYNIYILDIDSLELIRLKEQPFNAQYPTWRPAR